MAPRTPGTSRLRQHLRGWLIRGAALLLAPGRTRVEALAQVIELRTLARFGLLFALTILAPALALVYFSLASIEGEALEARALLERDARAAAGTAAAEVGRIFTVFEDAVRRRLESGRSPLQTLRSLSPHLQTAWRLAGDGSIAAPFGPASEEPIDHTLRLRKDWREAARLEREAATALEAARRYAALAVRAQGRADRGQASLARARALHRAGRSAAALALLRELEHDYPEVRDVFGFRLPDLARLMRGEWLLQAGRTDEGRRELLSLVDSLLDAPWSLGHGGEGAVAGRALDALAEAGEGEDRVARYRGRLDDRARHLFWSEQRHPELAAVLGSVELPGEEGRFLYVPRGEVLWAFLAWGSDRYAFTFGLDELLSGPVGAAAERALPESQLHTVLLPPGSGEVRGLLARRSLSPYLPAWSVGTVLADTGWLSRIAARKRAWRLLSVLVAIVLIATGVVIAIRLVRHELEVARVKADFAANVSHELRSPITQIRLKGEALQLGLPETPEELEAHYDAIVREAERLSRLVDNVLDLAAIERGTKTYTLRPGDLGATVRDALEGMRHAMELRDMELEVDIAPDLPPVRFDPDAINQVLQNLVSNAAKYGSEGGWIGVAVRREDEGVRVEISDRGIGIPPEDLPRIFEEYYRSSSPEARRRKGTGIGLAIVRYIVEAHGGRIGVRSRVGAGTTFALHFPAMQIEAVAAPPPQGEPARRT